MFNIQFWFGGRGVAHFWEVMKCKKGEGRFIKRTNNMWKYYLPNIFLKKTPKNIVKYFNDFEC